MNFASETGVIEFFLIGSASSYSQKKVQRLLAVISGFPSLPLYSALGFHYSKWDEVTSATRIVQLNKQFEQHQFPVDYFWMDLPHTEGYRYFTFNKNHFPLPSRDRMHHEISLSKRRLVVITDPHLKQDMEYEALVEGIRQNRKTLWDGRNSNIFVQNANTQIFFGECWPGASAWIDFFNEAGADYWASLYNYETFRGTNNLYQIWIDMNEPSVFKSPEGVMKKSLYHSDINGRRFTHGEAHNAYGLMMARATYLGL